MFMALDATLLNELKEKLLAALRGEPFDRTVNISPIDPHHATALFAPDGHAMPTTPAPECERALEPVGARFSCSARIW